jgi:hypothetical protein
MKTKNIKNEHGLKQNDIDYHEECSNSIAFDNYYNAMCNLENKYENKFTNELYQAENAVLEATKNGESLEDMLELTHKKIKEYPEIAEFTIVVALFIKHVQFNEHLQVKYDRITSYD